MSVEKDGERIANNPLAMFINFGDLIARQHHAEAPRISHVPIAVSHFCAVGLEPVEVFGLRAMNRPALKKIASAEDRLRFAQAREVADELAQRALFRREVPIEPRQR
jgi:hypothetical protein